MSKKKQRKQRQRSDWQKVINQWQKSRLSVREFCQRHGISETSFYQGRRRLRALAIAPGRKNPRNPFIEVALPSLPASPARLEIIWAQPPVLKIHPGCEAELLERTLRCLREQTC